NKTEKGGAARETNDPDEERGEIEEMAERTRKRREERRRKERKGEFGK
ncbi:unnamed protein product, partial [Heterotrigona itama]